MGKGLPVPRPRTAKKPERKALSRKSAESLAEIRAQALAGLSDLVAQAVQTLQDSITGTPVRGQGSRSADARYILDAVLDRVSPPVEAPEDAELDDSGQPTQTPVDELAVRRAELQKLLRAQRKDADRDKRK